jgi:uncharacterized membrane protein (UPF0127 family)
MRSRRGILGKGTRHVPLAILCLLAVTALAACVTPREKVTLRAAGQEISVEVARTEAQREHGLMGRTDLGPRDGMIFVFDRDDHLSFWMKNTPTALSIAFLSSEGRILEIVDMEPYSQKVIRSRLSARYALEMRQGAFAALGIREGDTFSFPADFPQAR